MKKPILLILMTTQFACNFGYAMASPDLNKFKEQVVRLKIKTEATLKTKTYVLPKELSGQLSGELSGKIEGTFSEKSRISSIIGLGMIGALTGGAAAILPTLPFLASATGLGSYLLLGGAVGAGAGALIPEEVASGKLSGSVQGSIQGSNWENIYDGRLRSALVIDPNQMSTIALAEQDKNYPTSECLHSYNELLSRIVQSKRFLTTNEAKNLLIDVAQISSLLNEIELISVNLAGEEQKNVAEFIQTSKKWLEKKIIFLSVGSDALSFTRKNWLKADFSLELFDNKNNQSIVDENQTLSVVFEQSSDSKLNAKRALVALDKEISKASKSGGTYVSFKLINKEINKTQYYLIRKSLLNSVPLILSEGFITYDTGVFSDELTPIAVKYLPMRKTEMRSKHLDICQNKSGLENILMDSSVEQSVFLNETTDLTSSETFGK